MQPFINRDVLIVCNLMLFAIMVADCATIMVADCATILFPILWMAATPALDLTPALLLIYPGSLCTQAYPGRFSDPGPERGFLDHFHQPLDGVGAVLLLGAVAPGCDDQDPVLAHPSPRQLDQARVHLRRQGWRAAHVEAKLNRSRHLVHVLAARPRRAHELELDLALVEGKGGGDRDHGASISG